MDFFARQEDAAARSRAFYLAFGLAVALAVIVFYFVVTGCLLVLNTKLLPDPSASLVHRLPAIIYGSPQRVLALRPFLIVSGLITAFILTASWLKTRAIRRGGGAYVAEALGGEALLKPRNAQERQLVNVVEEMAVASGLPRPRLYLMPHELTINAVTAGLDRDDAVIAVTQGSLNLLTREELQGVVAHEFAHILNEDCALNLTMAGWLYGLLIFSVEGKEMLSMAGSMMEADDDGRILPPGYLGIPLLLLGLILWVGGWLGKLAAELVQAAFSRQREHLADAFAVQFTRQPAGLAGALKKIAGLPRQGALKSGQSLLLQSFFIVSPARVRGLWRSHPPLEERILALEPGWDGVTPEVDLTPFLSPDPARKLRQVAHGTALPVAQGLRRLQDLADGLKGNPVGQALVLGLLAAGGASSASKAAGGGLDWAHAILDALPEELRAAASDPDRVSALVAAAFLHDDPDLAAGQREIMEKLLGPALADEAGARKAQLGDRARLPLLELAVPTLKGLDETARLNLARTIKALAAADRKLDLFEVAAIQIVKKALPLGQAETPAAAPVGAADYLKTLQEDVVLVLSILAYLGAADPGEGGALPQPQNGAAAAGTEAAPVSHVADEARSAFAAGLAHVTHWPPYDLVPRELATARELARALDRLGRAPVKIRDRLVLASVSTALHDRRITPKEDELLRALAAALGIPVFQLQVEPGGSGGASS